MVFTQAEVRVIQKLIEGYSNEEIAAVTGRAVKTIKFHIRRIFKKTKTKNRPEFMALYFKNFARLRGEPEHFRNPDAFILGKIFKPEVVSPIEKPLPKGLFQAS